MSDRIDKIADDVAYIRGQIDGMRNEIISMASQSTDHETRIRGLERVRNYSAGIGTMVMILFGISNS